ncbi:MAG: tetratricopeptide repeat protein [Streptomyces sp.]|uniref:tetratricopeptide repeat protein n=1 Tax=Streptomyces sp. TaxID=1931 RepID=UPI0025FF7078|nr:tetratricopeptide repeat protein [Streptomyces sp.]MBW8795181.1 tetratricopeptide repeat protein [Streptomyces sp.]
MGPTRPSMQELIGRRRRAGFVGRVEERAAFRRNLQLAPEDERHRFLFHVHGAAGVGKTRLVRELEQIAREAGALTAYVDEGVAGVPEAMAALARQFAAQGRRVKELERLLAVHRERRHEVESALVLGGAEEREGPSAGSLAVARAAQVGLGMVPVAGAFAVALDADRLAQGADRLRARFRSQEDVQLVLSPERVLTPLLLTELAGVADTAPWIVLLLDTYERTGPFLDPWLHDVMTTDRYGALPANVVVVTSGQRPFDTARWGSFADFRTDLPLRPFTEAEARGLLADKGVRDEPVVAEVLRLTGGLPVLVSTLAESGPVGPAEVGDPSATAVDRFLKWERDPVRRAAALAGALPRQLDEDLFRSVVEGSEDQTDALFAWLRGMPFVDERGGRMRYHGVVRAPMLRLQRLRSPRGWAARHTRLAEAYGRRRAEAEADVRPEEPWTDEEWRELRLGESYHLLCARPRSALPTVLADLVTACAHGDDAVRPWVRLLAEAGQDADAEAVRTWGADLSEALAGGGLAGLLRLLLDRTRGEEPWRATAWALRADALARDGAHEQALEDYGRALALDPALVRAHRGRAVTRGGAGDYEGALADLDRVLELEPDNPWNVILRGEHHRLARHHDEAVADLSEGVRRNPTSEFAWASRGAAHERHGDLDAALADFDRALALKPDYAWALARRSRVWRGLGDPGRRLADLDRALALQPAWAWGRCERGDALRLAGRDEEALADYDRALELDPEYAYAYASRGVSLSNLGRHEEGLADLDHAIALQPDYPWALEHRAAIRQRIIL